VFLVYTPRKVEAKSAIEEGVYIHVVCVCARERERRLGIDKKRRVTAKAEGGKNYTEKKIVDGWMNGGQHKHRTKNKNKNIRSPLSLTRTGS
jgi:hypothetical protein